MRSALAVFLIIITGTALKGQNMPEPMEGTVSFVTSQNVYVKFTQTQTIQNGDTLFIKQGTSLIPVLVVKEHSSMSVVGEPISSRPLVVNDKIYHFTKPGSTTVGKPEPTVQPSAVPAPVPPPQPTQTYADT